MERIEIVHHCEAGGGYELVFADPGIGEDTGWRVREPDHGAVLGEMIINYCPWCGVLARFINKDTGMPLALRSTRVVR